MNIITDKCRSREDAGRICMPSTKNKAALLRMLLTMCGLVGAAAADRITHTEAGIAQSTVDVSMTVHDDSSE